MDRISSRRILRKWLRLGIASFWAATLPWSCSHEHELPSASAQSAEVAARPTLEEVAGELICDFPSCSKESLRECTSCEYAVKYRKEIATLLEEGKTKPEILNHFGNTYGEQLLSNPRSWTAAGIPYLVVLLSLVPLSIVLRLRRSKTQKPPVRRGNTSSAASKQEPEEDARLAEALRDYDY